MTNSAVKQVSEGKANLISICEKIKLMELMTPLFAGCSTMNEKLEIYYKLENQQLNTFKGWLDEGRAVRKGEKGFAFWTKPKTATKKDSTENESESSYKFFNVCYLFTKEQTDEKI